MTGSAQGYGSAVEPYDPEAVTYNTAESGSSVGIQTENVTGSTVHMTHNVYQAPPGTSAEETYRRGVHLRTTAHLSGLGS